jgi:hypothetical protein
MSVRQRVRNRRTVATGTIEWRTPNAASVAWDDPLTSGARVVPVADLEDMEDE